jgi:hypothetical protein
MDRAAISTLRVPISIDLHLAVIEDRVVRNEEAMFADSVAGAAENAVTAWLIRDRAVRDLVDIADRTMLIADMVVLTSVALHSVGRLEWA